jgi:hypothetical protein
MSACIAWLRRRRVAPAVLTVLLLIGAPAVAETVVSVGQPIIIHLDQARVIKVPERTATLVIGNPLIADVSMQAGGIMVVTGKGYGVTNLLALDRTGALLMEHPVEVQGPRDQIVTLYRGIERESYSCTPKCERRVTLGDTAPYFASNLMQTGTLNNQAQAAGPRN